MAGCRGGERQELFFDRIYSKSLQDLEQLTVHEKSISTDLIPSSIQPCSVSQGHGTGPQESALALPRISGNATGALLTSPDCGSGRALA